MLDDSLMARLEAVRDSLSDSHQNVATYILNAGHKAAFLTAAKIAYDVGVSESTVVRFAQKLGFSGVPELKEFLRRNLLETLSPQERHRAVSASRDERELANESLRLEQSNLQRTFSSANFEKALEVARLITAARQRYIAGLRSSRPIALLLDHYLRKILPDVKTFTQADPLMEGLGWLQREDLLLAFSFPRYSKATIEAVRIANKLNVTTVVITDSEYSPPAQVADLVLVAPANSIFFGNSFTSAVALVNCILEACVLLAPDEFAERLERLESLAVGSDRFTTP